VRGVTEKDGKPESHVNNPDEIDIDIDDENDNDAEIEEGITIYLQVTSKLNYTSIYKRFFFLSFSTSVKLDQCRSMISLYYIFTNFL